MGLQSVPRLRNDTSTPNGPAPRKLDHFAVEELAKSAVRTCPVSRLRISPPAAWLDCHWAANSRGGVFPSELGGRVSL